MRNTNKKILIASLLGIASIATIGSTFAFGGNKQRLELDDGTRTAIHEAILNNDYATFTELTASLENHPEISQERFEEMTERVATRGENREERIEDREQKRAEMQEIMDNEDYDAWKEIARDDMLEIVNSEEKFSKLVEAHKHMEAAREIREELGLPERKMNKPDMQNQHKNLFNK